MKKKFLIPALNKTNVAVLVLALIVGGVGSHAAGVLNSPAGGYLVCVNSTTKALTYPAKTTCPSGFKKLILSAQGLAGSTGIPGKDGRTLLNGIKDPESTVGLPGDMFINATTKVLFGPKDVVTGWPVGVSMVGPQGPGGSGSVGPAGAAGTNATIAITELFLCDGSDDGTTANEKCKIGMTGPGGGTIFFVDYNDIYPGFNYLEAAPTSCEADIKTWSSAKTDVTAARGWAARAVGAGQANTTAIKAVFTADANTNNAAYFATSCLAGSKSDWFLGSLGEMKLMYDNLQGLGDFKEWYYWSSTELDTDTVWIQHFLQGNPVTASKSATQYVRPIRSF
jgi:hypothetical protein